MLSDTLKYHNMARITTFSDKFKYTFVISFFPHPTSHYDASSGGDGPLIGDGQAVVINGIYLFMSHRHALVLHVRTLYKDADVGSLSLAVTEVLKGGVDMFTVLGDSFSEYGITMFSDDVIHTSFIATLAGALDVGFSTAWQVYAQVSVLAKGSYLQSQQAFNHHAWDVQFVMGTTFSF